MKQIRLELDGAEFTTIECHASQCGVDHVLLRVFLEDDGVDARQMLLGGQRYELYSIDALNGIVATIDAAKRD
jgi:hypothetical protein